tara:strand:- start:379 stop:798 length:420 start_codon:yes stop_codon:yes gene_type:complete
MKNFQVVSKAIELGSISGIEKFFWGGNFLEWCEEEGSFFPEVEPVEKRIVCPECEGEGKSSDHLGYYTASEWEREDPDFREFYMGGGCDRVCQTCRGKRIVITLDKSELSKLVKDLVEDFEDELDRRRRERESETRYGW